jgi:death-on-curing protein
MQIDYLSQFDMLQIRTKLAAEVHEQFAVMNLNGLQSAIAAPRQVVFGQELHPTLWDKAAALLTLLIKNHPFYDGNKRIAFRGVREFLCRNGWDLVSPSDAEKALTRNIVMGRSDVDDVKAWLQANARTKNQEQRTKNREPRT